jgi:hypothetical protein
MPFPQKGESGLLLELLNDAVGNPSAPPTPPNVPPPSAPVDPPFTVPPTVPPMGVNGSEEAVLKVDDELLLFLFIQSKQAGRLSKFSTQLMPRNPQYTPPPRMHSSPVQPFLGEETEEEDLLDRNPLLEDERELDEPEDPVDEVDEPEELEPLEPFDPPDELEDPPQKSGLGEHSNVLSLYTHGPRRKQVSLLQVTYRPQ